MKWPPVSYRTEHASPHSSRTPCLSIPPAIQVTLLPFSAHSLVLQKKDQRPRFVWYLEIRSQLRKQRKTLFICTTPIHTHKPIHIHTNPFTSTPAFMKRFFYFKDMVQEGQLLNHISAQSTLLWNKMLSWKSLWAEAGKEKQTPDLQLLKMAFCRWMVMWSAVLQRVKK